MLNYIFDIIGINLSITM